MMDAMAVHESGRDMDPVRKGWQVWSYEWSEVTPSGPRPIPKRVLFGGHIFPTRKAAESYWYDGMPGRNDRAVYVKV